MIITAENICSREMGGIELPRTFQHTTNKFKQKRRIIMLPQLRT
jgi:hypothetical protein